MRPALRSAALVLLALASPAAAAPMGPDNFVVLDQEALLVTPPRQVASGMVSQAEWSPDGKYVLAFTSQLPYPLRLPMDGPPVVRGSLVLWDASTGEAREIWSRTGPLGAAPRFTWFSRGEAAAVLLALERPIPTGERKGSATTREERWLYRLDARKGLMKPLQRVGENADLSPSPAVPVVVVWGWGDPLLRLVRLDGAVSSVPLPPGAAQAGVTWLAGGEQAWVGTAPGPNEKKPRPVVADLAAGKVAVVDERPPLYNPAPPGAGSLRVVTQEIPLGPGGGSVRTLWLETTVRSEKPRSLLAADAEWGRLSPTGETVLYVDDKGTWAIRPLRMPREAFVQARLAAQREQLMNNGKQLGLALHLYAADHDERFPSPEGVVAALQPYLKSAVLFEGFTYTYGGGSLADIEKPAEVPLGHVIGAGGRAVIYADGHVRWEGEGR